MGWQYDPKQASDTLPEGGYDAELQKVQETESKAGNPMLVLEWAILRPERAFVVIDYIVNPAGLWKYKQIAVAMGLGAEFEVGTFDAAEHIGKLVRVDLTIQRSEQYGDKNQVKKYSTASFEPRMPPAEAEMDAHDIPF